MLKTNDIKLETFTFFIKGAKTSPDIYLRGLFEQYVVGSNMSMNQVMHKMIEIYEEDRKMDIPVINLYDYEKNKDKIIINVINQETIFFKTPTDIIWHSIQI